MVLACSMYTEQYSHQPLSHLPLKSLLFAMLMIFEMFSVVDTKSDVFCVLFSIPFWSEVCT